MPVYLSYYIVLLYRLIISFLALHHISRPYVTPEPIISVSFQSHSSPIFPGYSLQQPIAPPRPPLCTPRALLPTAATSLSALPCTHSLDRRRQIIISRPEIPAAYRTASIFQTPYHSPSTWQRRPCHHRCHDGSHCKTRPPRRSRRSTRPKMRPSILSAAILPASLWSLVAARLHHLVPEDPYAFPKYRVTFLNGLPLLNDTAQQWLQNGLEGGELEFLDQPWREDSQWRKPPVKGIEGSNSQQDGGEQTTGTEVGSHPFALEILRLLMFQTLYTQLNTVYKLESMKIGPRTNYLCLIPPPPPENTSVPAEEPTTEVTPVHSWSLLQPLSGGCLYVCYNVIHLSAGLIADASLIAPTRMVHLRLLP